MRSFIRLLQEYDQGDPTRASTAARSGRGGGGSQAQAEEEPGEFLTLRALEAFVDGDEDFLARCERGLLRREQSRSDGRCGRGRGPVTAPPARNEGSLLPLTRASSWTDEDGDEDDEGQLVGTVDGTGGRSLEQPEGHLLEKLKAVLGSAADALGGRAGSGGGIEGHLSSFDLDDDGALSVEELAAALRSCGARGGQLGGLRGLRSLARHLGGGRVGGDKTLSIARIVDWSSPPEDRGRREISAGGRDPPGGGGLGGAGGSRDETRSAGLPGAALQRAVRLAEGRGVTLERTFARLDDDGDGYITLGQLLRGLDGMGIFQHVSQGACHGCSARGGGGRGKAACHGASRRG